MPPRTQEFPTLPPKPPKVLPKPEEDKKFFKTVELLKQDCMHNMQSVLLGENPLRGVSPRLRGFRNNINP